jgi:hypothetical protein
MVLAAAVHPAGLRPADSRGRLSPHEIPLWAWRLDDQAALVGRPDGH